MEQITIKELSNLILRLNDKVIVEIIDSLKEVEDDFLVMAFYKSYFISRAHQHFKWYDRDEEIYIGLLNEYMMAFYEDMNVKFNSKNNSEKKDFIVDTFKVFYDEIEDVFDENPSKDYMFFVKEIIPKVYKKFEDMLKYKMEKEIDIVDKLMMFDAAAISTGFVAIENIIAKTKIINENKLISIKIYEGIENSKLKDYDCYFIYNIHREEIIIDKDHVNTNQRVFREFKYDVLNTEKSNDLKEKLKKLDLAHFLNSYQKIKKEDGEFDISRIELEYSNGLIVLKNLNEIDTNALEEIKSFISNIRSDKKVDIKYIENSPFLKYDKNYIEYYSTFKKMINSFKSKKINEFYSLISNRCILSDRITDENKFGKNEIEKQFKKYFGILNLNIDKVYCNIYGYVDETIGSKMFLLLEFSSENKKKLNLKMCINIKINNSQIDFIELFKYDEFYMRNKQISDSAEKYILNGMYDDFDYTMTQDIIENKVGFNDFLKKYFSNQGTGQSLEEMKIKKEEKTVEDDKKEKIACKVCGKEIDYNEYGTCSDCHNKILQRIENKKKNNDSKKEDMPEWEKEYARLLNQNNSKVEDENKENEDKPQEKKFCTNCGKEVDKDWKFCKFCGSKID